MQPPNILKTKQSAQLAAASKPEVQAVLNQFTGNQILG
jgi:hypothetical protein